MITVLSNANPSPSVFGRVIGLITESNLAHLAQEFRAFAAYVGKDYKAARAQYPFLEW